MTPASRILEVCVDSLESAIAAINGGANRLELCSSLSEGGLTPTPGLLQQILSYPKSIEIFCMLRCRPGDFVYTQEEVDIMVKDANILKKCGAHGFVFGVLTKTYEVNMKLSRDIITACLPLPVTFHRAFDYIRKPIIELEVIIDLGFKRLLTSGQQSNAQLGVKLIKKLINQVRNRIIIIPGGGINLSNLEFIIQHTEAKEYHGSFKKIKTNENNDNGNSNNDVTKEVKKDFSLTGVDDTIIYIADQDTVSKIAHILKNV